MSSRHHNTTGQQGKPSICRPAPCLPPDPGRRLVVLIVGPRSRRFAGGQAKFTSYLVRGLRAEFDIVELAIPERRPLPWAVRLVLSFGMTARLACLLVARRVDVVHVLTPCSAAALCEKLLFITLARVLGCPAILNFRNALEQWSGNWTALETKIFRTWFRAASLVICQYDRLAQYLAESGLVSPARLRVVPNGIGLGEVSPRRIANGSTGSAKIVLVGSIGRRKGADTLLRAAARLEALDTGPFSIELAGPDESPAVAARLRRWALRPTLHRRVSFCGRLTHRQTMERLRDADIFVLVSHAEGFPNGLLEAMAAGLPVVVSNRGAMPEVIADGEGGFVVEPGDVGQLADRLRRLVASPALRKLMGQRNRLAVETHYELTSVLKQFAAVYRQSAEQCRRSWIGWIGPSSARRGMSSRIDARRLKRGPSSALEFTTSEKTTVARRICR